MAATPTPSALSGLARALVQAGRLKEAEAEASDARLHWTMGQPASAHPQA